MSTTEPDIDLQAVQAYQPPHQREAVRSARPRPSGSCVYCFACEQAYLSTEDYWEHDTCPDLGEAYGVGLQ